MHTGRRAWYRATSLRYGARARVLLSLFCYLGAWKIGTTTPKGDDNSSNLTGGFALCRQLEDGDSALSLRHVAGGLVRLSRNEVCLSSRSISLLTTTNPEADGRLGNYRMASVSCEWLAPSDELNAWKQDCFLEHAV